MVATANTLKEDIIELIKTPGGWICSVNLYNKIIYKNGSKFCPSYNN